LKVCTLADVPLEQSGALPGDKALRRNYILRLFEQHLSALKSVLAGSAVSIVDPLIFHFINNHFPFHRNANSVFKFFVCIFFLFFMQKEGEGKKAKPQFLNSIFRKNGEQEGLV